MTADPDGALISVSARSGVKTADLLFGNHRLLADVIAGLG